MELATTTPVIEIIVRLALASLFGMVLGLDREMRGKPAGLRTHMLIALGAAVTTLVAFELYYSLAADNPEVRADPLRAIEGVAAAIGFLGAGAIIRGAEGVHNMTTAANIWLCGAIGLACGGGYYVVAGITFAFTITILTLVRFLERGKDREVDD